MDWEQVAITAQIITGVATLGVAVFLASQLRLQHRDSQKDITMRIQSRLDTYRSAMGKDRELSDLFIRGQVDYQSLDQKEKQQFFWLATGMMTSWMNMGEYEDSIGYDMDELYYGLFSQKGTREFFSEARNAFPQDFQNKIDALIDRISSEGEKGVLPDLFDGVEVNEEEK